jgi:hypothetical protein
VGHIDAQLQVQVLIQRNNARQLFKQPEIGGIPQGGLVVGGA